jgi:predicted alpha/beta hydrolase
MEGEAGASPLDFPPFTVPVHWYAAPDSRATVVILPAMGTPAHRYRLLAEALQSRAFSVLLPELPGTGASTPKPSRKVDYGYGELVGRYLPGMVAAARERLPGSPLLAVGHSLGGQIAVLGVAHGQADLDAVVTVASGHIHYRNWHGAGRAKVLFAALLFPFLTHLFGYLPGRRVGFGGPQARTLIREWARTIRSGRFPDVGGPRGRRPCPLLSIGYEGDFFAPMRSVAGLAELLQGETERLPVNWPGPPHSAWTRYPGSTVRAIENWLLERGLLDEPRVAPA